MPVPATTGQLRTNIVDMEIGDYIVGNYNRTTGTYTINDNTGGEMPLTGLLSTGQSQGYFYYIKSDKGFLIGDRVIANTISWDVLNANKFIQGKPQTFDTFNGILRSLTGGVAYADANGDMSLTDLGFGAFPGNNEWDKYIFKFPVDKIQSGKTLNDVFHWSGVYTFTQDTPIVLLGAATRRVMRGHVSDMIFSHGASTYAGADVGFRPVFEYKEV